ncbi:AAA-like domain protein [Rubripirellula lacrimiformis]|uniref:AAA-like domain protein n=2 Tax=Rubripirellula lacrimiformis TaxID=1930273 RepID=A0A517NAT0_9BACT|nr:AAA-like domain protein [Rubripirellula lacrimiformis]
MHAIAEKDDASYFFSNWDLISRSRSQLRKLAFTPWLDSEGKVQKWSKLLQTEIGAQPFAVVGHKGEIQVRWESDPKSPEGLDKWRIEMIPSLDFYATSESPDVALPVKKVKGTVKRSTIKLSTVDWPEDTSSIVVQVRLTALSESGAELANDDDKPYEAISEEIQLRPSDDEAGTEVEASKSVKSNRDIPLAKLRLAVEREDVALAETAFQWSGTGENVFTLSLNSGDRIRISLSPMLKEIESRTLDHPNLLGIWEVDAIAGETLSIQGLRDHETSVKTTAGKRFQAARQHFWGQLRNQGPRRWIATAHWSDDLLASADAYVDAYLNWIGDADTSERQLALSIDTGLIALRCDGRTISASLTSPLHPLRVAWFRTYLQTTTDLIDEISRSSSAVSERKANIDLDSFELIEPTGCPMLTTAIDGAVRLTSGCLDFLWTAALPVDWPDPARALSLVSQVLSLSSNDQGIGDALLAKSARHIDNYVSLHPHARKIRVVTDNAGDGSFASQVLIDSVRGFQIDDVEESGEVNDGGIESIELLAHFRQPLPSTMPGMVPLRQSLEQRGGTHATSAFQPLLETSIRDSEQLTELAEGGSHLTMLMDITTVMVTTEDVSEDRGTAVLGGLLCPFRLLPGGPPWKYCVSAPSESDSGILSSTLLKHQQALASVLELNHGGGPRLPVLNVGIAGDVRRLTAIHEQSDWVITLDRFVEPAWVESHAGMRYLLDYSPDITDGLSRRLFVTTGHREEAEQVISETLSDLGFDASDTAVTRVLHRLQQVSGRLALRALSSGSSQREAAALAIAVEKLHFDGKLNDTILVPVDSHIEMFTPFRRKGRPEKRRRCDLLLVRPSSQNEIEFELIEVKGRTHRPSPDVFAAIQEQVESTDRLVQSLWCNTKRYDRPIQLYRLRQILEYHLRRAQGFGTVTDTDHWNAILERLTNGQIKIKTTQRGIVVCTSAMPEVFYRGNLEIEVVGDISLDFEASVTSNPSLEQAFLFEGLDEVTDKEPSEPGSTTGENRSSSEPAMPVDSSEIASSDDVQKVASQSDLRDANSASPIVHETPPKQPPTPALPQTPERSELDDLFEDLFQDDDANAPVLESRSEVDLPVEPLVSHQEVKDQDNLVEVPTFDEPDCEVPGPERPADDLTDQASQASSHSDSTNMRKGDVAIVLGDGESGPAYWRPSVSGSPHLFVIGIPGQGKSVTTTRILCELTTQSVPALVLDFHGEFADPDGPFNQLAKPAILNAADGLPFSILEPKNGSGPRAKEGIWELAEICQYVCGLGDIQRDAIYQAFERAYAAVPAGATPSLASVANFLREEEGDGNVKNVIARCRPLFEFGLFADNPTEGISEQFTKGAVIDVHELKSETLQLAAGAFTLRKLYRAMFTWGTADRIRLAIVLDEAHRLAKDVTLPKIMKEGRKFGIAVVVASQDVRDFHDQVLSNAGTKVIFRVNYPDSRKVSGFVRSGSSDTLAEQIERLPVAESMIQTPDMPNSQQIRMRSVNDNDSSN